MEFLHTTPRAPVRAVLFDFDGTISTLRFGWEGVMRALMLDLIAYGEQPTPALVQAVDAYIDESTGVQTIHQMKWLAARVCESGRYPDAPTDPWWYKAAYNRRLMDKIAARIDAVESGAVPPDTYLIAGAARFLRGLRARGVSVLIASGTDHGDVLREARALRVADDFDEISGAPPHSEDCAKEAAIRALIDKRGLSGDDIAVIGDGKVEIALVKAVGGRALGLATDEAARQGVSAVKRKRLIASGADAISGDFLDAGALYEWLGLEADS